MTKKGIIYCLLTIMLVVFLAMAVPLTNSMARGAVCRGVDIRVEQNIMSAFVTPDDIDRELGGISGRLVNTPVSEVPLQEIEDLLNALPNVESANCTRRTDNRVAIDVTPMVPVARVFDPSGSYYINRAGKHLVASTNYRIDMPVVMRSSLHAPEAVVAVDLLDCIEERDEWKELVSAIRIEDDGDLIIVPPFDGHVINFGDAANARDKFNRIFAFYRRVLPQRGWAYYDTISVKFANQVVATVAPGARKGYKNPFSNEDFDEDFDDDAITGESSRPDDITVPKI